MRKFKRLISILLAVCVLASFSFTAFAAEDEKIEVDTVDCGKDWSHLDVKANATYVVKVDGESVTLSGVLEPASIVVTVKTPSANINYKFADYAVTTKTEAGATEYRITLNGYDANLLNLIDWSGASFAMNNVYVSGSILVDAEQVPAIVAEQLEQNEDGKYVIDFVDYRYTGLQECTCGNGLRSAGNVGVPTGLDLYIAASGLEVVTPVEPETTEPETTEPADPTVPDETTAPVETAVPEETTEPEVTTVPETTTEPVPTDDVPETGDNGGMGMMMVLMCVSFVGLVATLVAGNKLKYVGKREK